MKLNKDELMYMVKEALNEYEIFFDHIPIDENLVLDLLVKSVYEMASKLSTEEREAALLTTICLISYENFKLTFQNYK